MFTNHEFVRALKRSPELIHIVPSLPPMQYKFESIAATPQLLLLEVIGGIAIHAPIRGSNRSTDD